MKKSLLALSVAVGISLTGCGGKDPQELIQSAQQNIQQGDEAAAVIELKNALQEAPQNAQARFLLGKVYTEQGAWAAAAKELEEAKKYGFDINAVVPLLALSYYSQSNLQQLESLSEIGTGLSTTSKAAVFAFTAMTLFELGVIDEAQVMVEEAKNEAPESEFSKLSSALQDIAAGNIDSADNTLDTIIESDVSLPEVYLFKGQIASYRENTEEAVAAFQHYVEARPKDYRGAIFYSNALLRNKEFEEAEEIVDRLLDVSSEQPFLNFMKATARFEAGDFESASIHADKAIQNGYNERSARVIAGISALRLDRKEQAYNHLNTVKDELGPDSTVLPLLNSLALDLGYEADAVAYLDNKDVISEQDVLVLSSLTTQLFKSGEVRQAREISERLKEADVNSSAAMLSRGALRLTLDDVQGITDLEAAIRLEPDSALANVSLAQAYIDAGKWEKAKELANTWLERNPDSADGPALLGIISEKKGEVDEAHAFFTRALEIDKSHTTANMYFARKYIDENKADQAMEHLNNVLEEHPSNVPALVLNYQLLKESGNEEKGLAAIRNALEADVVGNMQSLYVNALYSSGRYNMVIEHLESVDRATFSDKEWLVLANSHFYEKNRSAAVSVAREWLQSEPKNTLAHFQLISSLQLNGNSAEAKREAVKAVSSHPKVEEFKLILIALSLSSDDSNLAKSTFSKLSSEIKSSATGEKILAQIKMSEGNFAEAERTFKTLYKDSPDDKLTWLYAKSLVAQGKGDEAYAVYSDYLKNKKPDSLQLSHLAELAIRTGKRPEAIDNYIELVTVEPDNIKVLNNLAYLLFEAGRAEEALKYSDKAMELEPKNANVRDTHASVLVEVGRAQEAIEIFDELYSERPTDKKLIQKYSEALRAVGETEKANAIQGTVN